MNITKEKKAERLKAFFDEKVVSKECLARLTQVSDSTLQNIIKGKGCSDRVWDVIIDRIEIIEGWVR